MVVGRLLVERFDLIDVGNLRVYGTHMLIQKPQGVEVVDAFSCGLLRVKGL